MEEGPNQKPSYEIGDEPTTNGHRNTETKGNDEEKTSNSTVRLDLVFTHLSVFGTAKTSNTQETVASVLELPFRRLFRIERKQPKRQILHNIQGLIKSGELVAVLGKPGSGCSTFLKTVAGQLNGLELGENAVINFSGIAQDQMRHHFRGEIKYNFGFIKFSFAIGVFVCVAATHILTRTFVVIVALKKLKLQVLLIEYGKHPA